jgi:hypothetical protein
MIGSPTCVDCRTRSTGEARSPSVNTARPGRLGHDCAITWLRSGRTWCRRFYSVDVGCAAGGGVMRLRGWRGRAGGPRVNTTQAFSCWWIWVEGWLLAGRDVDVELSDGSSLARLWGWRFAGQ